MKFKTDILYPDSLVSKDKKGVKIPFYKDKGEHTLSLSWSRGHGVFCFDLVGMHISFAQVWTRDGKDVLGKVASRTLLSFSAVYARAFFLVYNFYVFLVEERTIMFFDGEGEGRGVFVLLRIQKLKYPYESRAVKIFVFPQFSHWCISALRNFFHPLPLMNC